MENFEMENNTNHSFIKYYLVPWKNYKGNKIRKT